MKISKISKDNLNFGYKMTKNFVKQEIKRKGTTAARKEIALLKSFANDNILLDYKNSEYKVVIPKYNVSYNIHMKSPYALYDIAKATEKCIDKIFIKSMGEKAIKQMTKKIKKISEGMSKIFPEEQRLSSQRMKELLTEKVFNIFGDTLSQNAIAKKRYEFYNKACTRNLI